LPKRGRERWRDKPQSMRASDFSVTVERERTISQFQLFNFIHFREQV